MRASYCVVRDAPAEHSDKKGAAALAKRIANFWAAQGVAVDCEVVHGECLAKGHPVYAVRSKLVFYVPKV